MNSKIRSVGTGLLVLLWAAIAGFLWFSPAKEMSEAERRPLAQAPAFSAQALVDGSFMKDFESYTLDQFPLRDTFRQVKSLFHYYGLQQWDNNDIYVTDGFAAKLEYPLNEKSVSYATGKFNRFYEKYLKETGSKVFFTVAPDKGYYLAEENGYLAMDYAAMFAQLREEMPWAEFVDLTECLDYTDYYRTDTHWRQEDLLEAATKLCLAMGVTPPQAQEYTKTLIQRPFYGVYYGQAALPMKAETLFIMESQLLSECRVYDHESGKYGAVYDMTKLASRDLYDVFLSGSRSLLTIENPNAATDRELIVVRDSFGSSMVPLLVQDYAKVTVVDIRYINLEILDKFVEFKGQDILFLYSTLVLNNSNTIK